MRHGFRSAPLKIAAAPLSPMPLLLRYKCVRRLFFFSAAPMALAPLSPMAALLASSDRSPLLCASAVPISEPSNFG